MMALGDFVVMVKRQANLSNISVTTDQITADIVNYINNRRARMWRKYNWDFGISSFNITATSGTYDYEMGSTIGKIDTISDGNLGTIDLKSRKFYLRNTATVGTPQYYSYIGLGTTGNLKIRIWPIPEEGATLAAFGILRLTRYSVSDIATNLAMDFFPNDYNDILLIGVLSDVKRGQNLSAEADSLNIQFESALTAMCPETENVPDKEVDIELPSFIIEKWNARVSGGVA